MAHKELQIYKAPTLPELIDESELPAMFAKDDFNTIINTPVPKEWIKQHPFVNIEIVNGDGQKVKIPLPYISVKKVKYLLKRIYLGYRWEIKECKQILNSIVVTGTLTVINPITGKEEKQDGIGATAIQMDKGATQGDLSAIKANAIQIGAPSAESYALKNAAEKFGDIFGGNIYDLEKSAYTPVFNYDMRNPPPIDDLQELYELKKESCTQDEIANIERVLNNSEKNSFLKIYKLLQSK